MSSSLGYRYGTETGHVRTRAVDPASETEMSLPSRVVSAVMTRAPSKPSPSSSCTICGYPMMCLAPHGLMMTLLLLGGAVTLPIVYYYVDVDYSSDAARATTIGLSGLATALVFLKGDCFTTMYNVQLGFYTGVEVKVIDTAIAYAMQSSTPTEQVWLSAVAASVIAIHLIPFYTLNNPFLVTSLAAIGVVLNTAVVVFLDSTLLVVAFGSGISFLMTAMCIIVHQCACPALMTSMCGAVRSKSECVSCHSVSLGI